MALARPVAVAAIEGLPGSTWGQLTHDVDELTGSSAMGYINQGVDWVTLPGAITLNTYAEFRYRFREENNDFFNSYGPAVGVELRKHVFKLGLDYYWERFPEVTETSNKLQYYLNWYYGWDLKRE